MENSHMTISQACDRAWFMVFSIGKEKVVCEVKREKTVRRHGV